MKGVYETHIELVGAPWSQLLPARVLRGTINRVYFTENTDVLERKRFLRQSVTLERTHDDGTITLQFWMAPRYAAKHVYQYDDQVVSAMQQTYFREALNAINATIAQYALGATCEEAKHAYDAPIYQPDGAWESLIQRSTFEPRKWDVAARRIIPKNNLTLPDLAYYIAHAPTWPPKDGHLQITYEP